MCVDHCRYTFCLLTSPILSQTREIIDLILDSNRNNLLALDLRTSITTLGVSAGTLWAGL